MLVLDTAPTATCVDRHAAVVVTATRSLAVTTLFALAPAFAMAAAAPTCTPSAVIFLHGSGDTGEGLQRGLANSRFTAAMKAAGVRLVFPSATPRPYQLAGGNTMSIWFDRTGLPPEAPEHAESIDASVAKLEGVLRELEGEGIPPSRVAVGGFSMGGGIAIQLAYRGSEIGSSLAAVFALSSFATDDSAMWSSLRASPDRPRPPLYQRHGDADDYILTEWGERTGKKLKDEGVAVDFGLEPGLRHSLSEDELVRLGEWLKGTVGE